MRYALGIEYNGTRYHGWQKQENAQSLQTALEKAIAQIANHPIATICAGRTDAGVHALQQVVHFDTTSVRDDHAWLLGINRFLPKDMSVTWIRAVPDHFHARYSATARRYAYVLHLAPVRSSVLAEYVTSIHRSLNIAAMQHASQYLVGEHDFTSFRAQECQAKTPCRTIQHLTLTQRGPLLIVDIKANAFLHHMVRNIVGTLLVVGRGEQPPTWVETLLHAKDRRLSGMTAPATGLHFIGVDYPHEFAIPAGPAHCWFG